MLLYPLRWLLRQVLGMLLTGLLVGVGCLWILKWIPLPPMRVVVGYFSGEVPQWGWLSETPRYTYLKEALKRAEAHSRWRQRPSLAQRVAEQLFYPADSPKWGSTLLGSLLELLWGEERLIAFYLNSIPYDRDVYGVKAAAQRRFQRDIEELTPIELAELLLRREGPPLSVPLSPPLVRELHRLERVLITASHGS